MTEPVPCDTLHGLQPSSFLGQPRYRRAQASMPLSEAQRIERSVLILVLGDAMETSPPPISFDQQGIVALDSPSSCMRDRYDGGPHGEHHTLVMLAANPSKRDCEPVARSIVFEISSIGTWKSSPFS